MTMTEEKLNEMVGWLKSDLWAYGDTFAVLINATHNRHVCEGNRDFGPWFYRNCGIAETAFNVLYRLSPFTWDDWEELRAVFLADEYANGAPTTGEFDRLCKMARPLAKELNDRWCEEGNCEFIG